MLFSNIFSVKPPTLKFNTENKTTSDQLRQQKSKTVINVGSNETVKSNSNVQIASSNLKGSNEKKDLSFLGNRRAVSQSSFVQQPFSGFGILQPIKKIASSNNFPSQEGFDEVDSGPQIFSEADSTLKLNANDRKCCCSTCTGHEVSFENKTKNSWLSETFDDDAMSGQPQQDVHSTTEADVENDQKLQIAV